MTSPGDSISHSSEKLFQRGGKESQHICDFGERGVHAIQHVFFFFFCRRFLLVMRDTHHHWRILVLFWIWRDIGILYFYYFILFFIFLDSKITAEGDCSHEIKRRLLLGRKVMTNLDSILKSRDTTLSTKVCLVKATFFPVVMYGCESWTTKKAEAEELMLLNCLVGEDSWESLGLQGDPTSPS